MPRKGCKSQCQKSARETALTLAAAAAGHAEVVQLLFGNGAKVNQNNTNDEKDAAALHRAAENRSKEIVQVLLANGADINLKVFWGDGPLRKFAKRNNSVVTQMLLKKGTKDNRISTTEAGMEAYEVLTSGSARIEYA